MVQTLIRKDDQPVFLPWEEITGVELKHRLNIAPGRIATTVEKDQTRIIGDNECMTLESGTTISDIPCFRYGAPAVAQRLAAEAAYISQIYRQQATFGYDPNLNLWYVYLPAFSLPKGWQQGATPILVTVNDQYPTASPDGFYLSNRLRHENGGTPAHYFETSSALNPLTAQGWAWFCVHPQGWKAQYDLRDGDSIAKYLTLIHLTMSQVVAPNFRSY